MRKTQITRGDEPVNLLFPFENILEHTVIKKTFSWLGIFSRKIDDPRHLVWNCLFVRHLMIFEEALYIWLLIVWDQMTFQTFDAICLIFEEALYIWSPIVCFFIKFKTIGLKLFVGQKVLLSIPTYRWYFEGSTRISNFKFSKNHLVIKLFLNYPDIFRLNGLDIVSATKITKTLKFNSQLEYKNIKSLKKFTLVKGNVSNESFVHRQIYIKKLAKLNKVDNLKET